MEEDKRFVPRKVLRAHAILTLEGMSPLDVQTIDITRGGMSIAVSMQLTPGQRCHIRFTTISNGRRLEFSLATKVIYCSLGRDGFKAGLRFIDIDAQNLAAIKEYMK